MKTPSQGRSPGALAFLLLLLLATITYQLSTSPALAQGTAFTYQGRLDISGAPYTGSAEFQPTLWNALTGGAQLAANSPATLIVGVTNGLFVLPLDFGANFPGANRWLQIEVRTTIGAFTTLAPRHALTPTPYAITASNLSGTLPAGQLSGTLPSAQLSGAYSGAVTLNNAANSFTGGGAGLTGLNASQLASGTVPDARLSANVSLLGPSIESAEITDGAIVAADVNAASFNTTFWQTGGNAGTTAGPTFSAPRTTCRWSSKSTVSVRCGLNTRRTSLAPIAQTWWVVIPAMWSAMALWAQ